MRSKLFIFFTALLCISAFQVHAQKAPSPYPLRNIICKFDSTIARFHWGNSFLTVFQYDSMHRPVSRNVYYDRKWWNIDTMQIYTYDSGGAFVHSLITRYDTTYSDTKKIKEIFAHYDGSGHPIYTRTIFYNDILPYDILDYNIHDSVGKVIVSASVDTFHSKGHKKLFTFNSSGKDSILISQDYDHNSWVNTSKINNFYDSRHLLVLSYKYLWDTGNAQWQVVEKDSIAYDSLNRRIQLDTFLENKSTSYWDLKCMDSIAYYPWGWKDYITKGATYLRRYWDSVNYLGNLLSYHLSYIGFTASMGLHNYSWSYDDSGRFLSRIIEYNFVNALYATYDSSYRISQFDSSDATPLTTVNRLYNYYYYYKYNGVETSENIQPEVTLFPDPNDGKFKVVLPENSIGKLEAYSITGQLVYSRSVHEEKILFMDISLPPGIYILQLRSNHGVYRTRFLIKR